jgi:hypothetical protein
MYDTDTKNQFLELRAKEQSEIAPFLPRFCLLPPPITRSLRVQNDPRDVRASAPALVRDGS